VNGAGNLDGIDLSGVDAKLDRADEHVVALTGETGAFMLLHDHVFPVECNADATEYVVRVAFATAPDTQRWGLLLGDYVHCLRSALDHLIYAVAAHETNADPPPNERKVMLPLKTTEQGFGDASYRIEDLSDPVRARIESLQPYPGRDNDHLAILEDLDVRDKHRGISVAVIRPLGVGIEVSNAPPGANLQTRSATGPLEDGAALVTLTFDRPAPGVQVQPNVSFAIGIPKIPGGTDWYDVSNLTRLLRQDVRRAIAVILGRPATPTAPPLIFQGAQWTATPMP
jgi:hypothetical protein